jgi:hypothetical protein
MYRGMVETAESEKRVRGNRRMISKWTSKEYVTYLESMSSGCEDCDGTLSCI